MTAPQDNTDLGPDVEVGTAIAARLLGVKPRTIRAYCDEDVLREGRDWRRNTPRSPYLIRRHALVAHRRKRSESEAPTG